METFFNCMKQHQRKLRKQGLSEFVTILVKFSRQIDDKILPLFKNMNLRVWIKSQGSGQSGGSKLTLCEQHIEFLILEAFNCKPLNFTLRKNTFPQ